MSGLTTSTWVFDHGSVAHLGSVREEKPGKRAPQTRKEEFAKVRILRILLVWHQRPLVALGTMISMEGHDKGGTQCE